MLHGGGVWQKRDRTMTEEGHMVLVWAMMRTHGEFVMTLCVCVCACFVQSLCDHLCLHVRVHSVQCA